MASIILKLKKGKTFEPVVLPPFEHITVSALLSWQGKPCVLEFDDNGRKVYAYGNESVRGKWEVGKAVMDMESFCNYWRYKLLEYGIDLFCKVENRGERIAIMTAEGLLEDEAHKYCDTKPHIYATQRELILGAECKVPEHQITSVVRG